MALFGDELSDLLVKLGAAPSAVSSIRLRANVIEGMSQHVAGWASTGGGIRAAEIRATRADIFLGPPAAAYLWRNATQSIPDSTVTDVQFENKSGDWSGIIRWLSATPELIVPSPADVDQGLLLMGHLAFAANATGVREVVVANHLNGVWYGESVASLAAAPATNATVVPFVSLVRLSRVTDGIKLQVHQKSGGALNISYVALNVVKIRRL